MLSTLSAQFTRVEINNSLNSKLPESDDSSASDSEHSLSPSPSSSPSSGPQALHFLDVCCRAVKSLSQRGSHAAFQRTPLLPLQAFEGLYSDTNPSGNVNLGVAENSLMTCFLSAFYDSRPLDLGYTDFTYGTAISGSTRLFTALASLFREEFHAHPSWSLTKEQIVCGNGCGTILESILSCLADPGDGVLIFRPYYPGFKTACEAKIGVIPVGVTVPTGYDNDTNSLMDALEAAYQDSIANGVLPKVMLLCNPHNPLGICYSEDALISISKWTGSKELELVVDEIYGMSTLRTPDDFRSILSFDPASLGIAPTSVHVVYGASKDWSSNGFRIGVGVTKNTHLVRAVQANALAMRVSSVADRLWTSLIGCPSRRNVFMNLNRRLLNSSYNRVARFLESHNISYVEGQAGHYLWIDLRKFMDVQEGENEWDAEMRLFTRVLQHGLMLGRGNAYSNSTPGFFRLTFAMREDHLEIGLARFELALGLEKTIDPARGLALRKNREIILSRLGRISAVNGGVENVEGVEL